MKISDYSKRTDFENIILDQIKKLSMEGMLEGADEKALDGLIDAMIEVMRTIFSYQDNPEMQVEFLYSVTLACMTKLCLEFNAFNFKGPEPEGGKDA